MRWVPPALFCVLSLQLHQEWSPRLLYHSAGAGDSSRSNSVRIEPALDTSLCKRRRFAEEQLREKLSPHLSIHCARESYSPSSNSVKYHLVERLKTAKFLLNRSNSMGLQSDSVYKTYFLLLCLQIFAGHAVFGGRLRLPHEARGRDEGLVRNIRPLIGILSEPGDGEGGRSGLKPADHPNVSYIASSYVKFVELGGARAVPLLFNDSDETLRQKFDAINGILFPGGGADLKSGLYLETATKLFHWAIEANDRGDYFPLYGVCLGLELFAVVVAKKWILEDILAIRKPAPLNFVDNAAKSKGIFKWFDDDLIEKLSVTNLLYENHQYGLTPSTFDTIRPLSNFFEVLTTTQDEQNKTYVSTIQGWKYPFTAIMGHPEKNAFEWSINTIPHTSDAIQITQSVANFFISEARKSKHVPSTEQDEFNLLIYNYLPEFSAKYGNAAFDEVYIFS